MPRSRSSLVDRVVNSSELALLNTLAFEIATTFVGLSVISQNLLWDSESVCAVKPIREWAPYVPAHVKKWNFVCEQIRAKFNTDHQKKRTRLHAQLDSRFSRAERRYTKLTEESFQGWAIDFPSFIE